MPGTRSRWIQFLVLLIGGCALAVGGCALFLNTLNISGHDPGPAPTIGAIGFVAGSLMMLIAVVWAVVAIIIKVVKPDTPAQPPFAPPPAQT